MRDYLKLSILFLLFACATTQEATWKGVPDVHMPYDRAWAIVVNTIAEKFDIEVSDAQSGYLRTGWKVTDTCWAGLLAGKVPCKKTRVIVRVEERSPFKVRVKVEKMESTALSGYDNWKLTGNDEVVEREVMEELFGRLKGQN